MLKSLFSKRSYLLFFLLLAILCIVFPAVLFASLGSQPQPKPSYDNYYHSDPSKDPIEIVSVLGPNDKMRIVNLSDQAVFIPNKTAGEGEKWENKTTQYVTSARCGDGQCTAPIENLTNCPDDCSTVQAPACGNGICSQSTYLATYDPPREAPYHKRVCSSHLNPGYFILPPFSILVGLFTGNLTTVTCVNEKVYIYQGWELRGEVWQKSSDPKIAANQVVCKNDCFPPSGQGCGVCGFDADGKLWPNFCSNGGYNMIDCVWDGGSPHYSYI